jgi:hypothetical protein
MDDRDLVEMIWQSPWMLEKIRTRQDYAQNLYAAFCNMQWCKREMWDILKEEYWSCSWRGAGGLVAEWQGKGGDYMDWYCSGMGGFATDNEFDNDKHMAEKKYVPEGTVTDEIAEDLDRLGWFPIPWSKDEI